LKRIDAVVMDVPAEVFYVSKSVTLKRAGEPFFRGTYNIGLRKGDDALKTQVDAAIDKIINDGTLEQVLRKWGLWNDAQLELQNRGKPVRKTLMSLTTLRPRRSIGGSDLATDARSVRHRADRIRFDGNCADARHAAGAWPMESPRAVQWLCTIYVEFFRGTPVLVQLLFLYFGLPTIGLAMPDG